MNEEVKTDSAYACVPKRCQKHSAQVRLESLLDETNVAELEGDIWFEPIKTLLKRSVRWQGPKDMQARSCVANGTPKQAKIHAGGSAVTVKCQLCPERHNMHRLYHCQGWEKVRTAMKGGLRVFENNCDEERRNHWICADHNDTDWWAFK